AVAAVARAPETPSRGQPCRVLSTLPPGWLSRTARPCPCLASGWTRPWRRCCWRWQTIRSPRHHQRPRRYAVRTDRRPPPPPPVRDGLTRALKLLELHAAHPTVRAWAASLLAGDATTASPPPPAAPAAESTKSTNEVD